MHKKLIIFSILVLVCLTALHSETSKHIVNKDIQIIQIQDSIYVHVSWTDSKKFGRYPSNGLIIIKKGEAILIDTPVNNEDTEILVNYIEKKMQVKVAKLIIGHFHDDCLGGLKYIKNRKIESIANILTYEKCKELNLPLPSNTFKDSYKFDLNGEKIICRFFGGGHTFDNITVWIADKKILFGGCLIKSLNSKTLGNLKDSRVDEWIDTIKKIKESYKGIKIIIPGHGKFGGPELLTHTISLVKKTYKH